MLFALANNQTHVIIFVGQPSVGQLLFTLESVPDTPSKPRSPELARLWTALIVASSAPTILGERRAQTLTTTLRLYRGDALIERALA